ncbi:MAG: ABC transporter permease [Lachnospiraceae bacterium]|nr:ABC transporter permease [Lachnospiraceae bacterium]
MELFTEVINTYIERKDWFLELTGQHIGLAAISILLAGVIGLLAGIWIAEHDRFSAPVLAVANVFYTVPSISLFGMLIPFIGIGNKTAIVALTIYGIMPMVRNTYTGIKGVSEEVIMAARGMGSTDFQIMTKIKLPLALGVIVAGIRNMVVMTISTAAIASFIGAGGLGVAVYRGITLYNTALTFGGSLLIAFLALLSDLLLGKLEKRIKKHS